MSHPWSNLFLSCFLLTLATHWAEADHGCPHCQGHGVPVWENVVTHRCKLVPDVKQIKKTVYAVEEVPFCLHKLPPLCSLKGCDCACPECDCPRYKRVLLKKEVVCEEVCGTKCVIEEVVEQRLVCRQVCPHCGCQGAAHVPTPGPVALPAPPVPGP
jgi:hypothetical protein